VGARGLESSGDVLRVSGAGPDDGLRQWRCRTMGRHLSARTLTPPAPGQTVTPPDAFSWDNSWYIELRPAACSEQTAAGACQRSSRNDLGYVGLRAVDKAFLPHHTLRRLPSAASEVHKGQRGRALLI
jgi:2'-5' RNA ligase